MESISHKQNRANSDSGSIGSKEISDWVIALLLFGLLCSSSIFLITLFSSFVPHCNQNWVLVVLRREGFSNSSVKRKHV